MGFNHSLPVMNGSEWLISSHYISKATYGARGELLLPGPITIHCITLSYLTSLFKCYMVGCRECIARITYASTTFHISDGIQTFRNTSCELLYLDTYQDHHQYTTVTPYVIVALLISNVLCIVHHVLWWLIPTVACCLQGGGGFPLHNWPACECPLTWSLPLPWLR